MDDQVDLSVGFLLTVGPGDRVEPGDPLGEVYARDSSGLTLGSRILTEAVNLRDDPPGTRAPLVLERVAGSPEASVG